MVTTEVALTDLTNKHNTMKAIDYTILPALGGCYIGRKLRGNTMSPDKKALTDQEMMDVIAWFAMHRVQNEPLILELSNGKLVTIAVADKVKKNEKENEQSKK